ncbi:NAD(P)-binding domain-containing protein [Streptomyces nogalater]
MVALPGPPAAAHPVDAVVVGAGLSGLYQLHRLRQLGLSTVVLEAGDDIGGTWYWNRYPGARCDIESLSYSYSFSPELDQEWQWSERYASQPEILRYIHHVADRFDLRRDVMLRTRVTRAVYDQDGHLWQLATDTGRTVTARFVILATGCMSVPKDPGIPGAHSFTGAVHHTARWPREDVSFGEAGRRDRHRMLGRPGHPRDRRTGGFPHRLPAHPGLRAAGATARCGPRRPHGSRPAIPSSGGPSGFPGAEPSSSRRPGRHWRRTRRSARPPTRPPGTRAS